MSDLNINMNNETADSWEDNDWENDNWEGIVIPQFTSEANQVELENRRKVEESDMQNSHDLFAEEEEDKTLLELERIEKEKAILPKAVTAPTAKKEKRVMSEEEIERRTEQAEGKKIKNIKKKKKKAQKKRFEDIFGEAEDDYNNSHADFEDKCV